MGYHEDVLAWLHDDRRDGMAITIFGSLKSIDSMRRIPSRIPVSILKPHRERDRNIELPTRDRERESPYAQEVDVRYLTNIKSLRNRIKSSYSCDQQLCPAIKQRMELHQLRRHCCKERDIDSQTVILQSPSKHRTSIKSGPNLVDTHSMQTNITNINNTNSEKGNGYNFENKETHTQPYNDHFNEDNRCRHTNHDANEGEYNNEYNRCRHNNHNSEDIEDDNEEYRAYCKHNLIDNASGGSINLKRTETRSVITPTKRRSVVTPTERRSFVMPTERRSFVTPKRNVYKDNVQKAVRQWFQEIPIYPNLGQKGFDRDNFLNDLVEKINTLSDRDESYDTNLKKEIDSSLNEVPMWYPGAKRDQDDFKKKLNDNLFNQIKNLNNKRIKNNSNENNRKRSSNRYSLCYSGDIEEEVADWLNMFKIRKSSATHINDKREMVQAIINKIEPLLEKPMNSCSHKTMLKCAIIDILNNLPVRAKCSANNSCYLNKFAEDLANRLLNIKKKTEHKYPNTQNAMYQQVYKDTKNNFTRVIQNEVNNGLEKTRFERQEDVKIEIANIIMDYVDSSFPVEEFDVNKEIVDLLKSVSPIPGYLASNIAQNIIKNVKCVLKGCTNNLVSDIKPVVTRTIAVYTSEEKCCSMNIPATSTPKKKRRDSVPKLNPEEIEYAEKVGNLIRAWMDTLPEQFNAPDEIDFKETMIKDLAGEITDEAKLEQLASVDTKEKEKWLKYLIYKWLHKLDVFDLEEVSPQIEELMKRVKDIPVPELTKPQHGNRQAMANIQHMESELGWEEYFVPKGKDILEDEISIWMNQQSDIFDTDKQTRNIKIHELAQTLESKLANKRPENEIKNDLAQWLGNIVKPDQRTNVGELVDHLKGRLIVLPQDATLAANRDRKVQERAELLEAKRNPSTHPIQIKTTDQDTINLDKTMQQFIGKFVEHNYDIDDPMARGAFSHLLKTKLQRLNPPTRKEVYDNFAKTETNKQFSREKFIKELDYIKDVSDWLKNIPIDASYNTVGNRQRVDFVVDLARNILEVEEQREENPEAMDYNMYMAAIISQFLVQLPIIEEYKNDKNMMFMMDQLVGKVITHRNNSHTVNDSLDTSGVHSENIGEFIEEFIRINGSEIADDEVKLEAWSARLLDEIKKMVRENADPKVLSKTHVYNRLTDVREPREESIKQFDDEFEYIKEISGWLKNLPLLPIDESDEEERIKMICELTEKVTERDLKKKNNPNDEKADAEFSEYIKKWISDLSLDESHEVVVEVVIKQLINRIERSKKRDEKPIIDLSKTKSTESINPKLSKKQSSKTAKGKSKHIKNPAGAIVDAIEKWSSSLPIKADDEKTIKTLKDDASKRLFQKVGELSIDPRTFNDDLLYQEILADEVDAIIEKLPNSSDLQSNKDKLRTDLVHNVVEAQKEIKENCAGEYYKQKLEHTIEASIPHPVSNRREYDPGFEIYKSRLANMFILENFDHANDAVKAKYERKVKDEIDTYYDSAKNRNAIPLTKDEMYNELYSVLFKVQIPDESSVVGEVEEIKTRCEIDDWFEQLPLKEAEGVTELLERDKILATLAKRIHEIEKMESKPADKIHKEIMKWINKFTFLPGKEGNTEQFANKLQETLKSSADKRKYVATESSSKSKKVKAKSKEKLKVNKNASQVSGPSSVGNEWPSQSERLKPKKKAAEIIIEIVEEWCNQLPIVTKTPQDEESAKVIKDNLCTKIIIKISELNMNPAIFNDVFQYNDLLDEELDILLADIPTCCNFEESKPARKLQLKDAIDSVKPLFKEEKAMYQYKQDLDTTVTKVLGKAQDTTAEREALFKNLKDEIVENFVQYNYDKDDDEGRQVYKTKVHDAVVKFLSNLSKNKEDASSNSLMKRNQLLCELAKIPIPSDDGFKEEVEEIRMKNEVSALFDELNISETDKNKNVNQVKSSLAKKLNDIELSGNRDGENKMKNEVTKSLKKANKEVKPEVVENFVNKLKGNEMIRRSPRKIKKDKSGVTKCNKTGVCAENTQKIPKTSADDLSKTMVTEKPNDLSSKRSQACLDGGTSAPDAPDSSFKDPSHLSSERTDACLSAGCSVAPDSSIKDQNHSQNIETKCQEICENLEASEPKITKTKRSKLRIVCECCKDRDAQDRDEDNEQESDAGCVCGSIKGRRACFMPMRWYCNPDDLPACRMPAGFFYY